jgi:hypothetical protein
MAAIAGPSYTLLGAAALFLIGLLLSARLSIDFTANSRKRVSNAKSEETAPAALTPGLLAV